MGIVKERLQSMGVTGPQVSSSPALNAISVAQGNSNIKPNLKELEGLKMLADNSGLKEEADRLLAEKGEDPKKIFSGGFVSDVFDVLNSLQYGVTGLVKGKTFMEGVKTRQSFSDKDSLGQHGLPGMVAGIALDIAFDLIASS